MWGNSKDLVSYKYDRKSVKAGVLHFGVGNFHRAHQEYYTNQLLEDPEYRSWGICGAMLMPGDERLYRILKKQDLEYSLTVCGRDGKNQAYRIGSLVELYWAGEDPEGILNKIADKDIRVITMTITEGGYNTDKTTGEFIFDNDTVQHDLKRPKVPKTTFGYVAEGLRRRMAAGSGPITILSCDNLQHNGDTARHVFTSFIERQDPELGKWVAKNVTFPNSMVDRITPATRPDDVVRLNQQNGTKDEAPVYTEDFIQWVIEDKFAAGRPPWDRFENVEFTDDVTAFENMKLSLLNASHQMLSYPSFLAGYRKVDDAMHDERIVKLLRTFMDKDITPYVPPPGKTDLALYKQTLIERFANRTVSDQVARLCMDGVSKFPVYIMPNLIKMVRDNADLTRQAYLFATYRHYLKYRKDDNGADFVIEDPWYTDEDKAVTADEDPVAFLGMSAFRSTNLKEAPKFVELYLKLVKDVKEKGTMATLESIL